MTDWSCQRARMHLNCLAAEKWHGLVLPAMSESFKRFKE